jgi:hypothetical protein
MVGSGGGGRGCHLVWWEIGYMLTSTDSGQFTVLTHKLITFEKCKLCKYIIKKKISMCLYTFDLIQKMWVILDYCSTVVYM